MDIDTASAAALELVRVVGDPLAAGVEVPPPHPARAVSTTPAATRSPSVLTVPPPGGRLVHVRVRGWWARGELNHSTPASDLRRYRKAQVTGVVLGSLRTFAAVLSSLVMP